MNSVELGIDSESAVGGTDCDSESVTVSPLQPGLAHLVKLPRRALSRSWQQQSERRFSTESLNGGDVAQSRCRAVSISSHSVARQLSAADSGHGARRRVPRPRRRAAGSLTSEFLIRATWPVIHHHHDGRQVSAFELISTDSPRRHGGGRGAPTEARARAGPDPWPGTRAAGCLSLRPSGQCLPRQPSPPGGG